MTPWALISPARLAGSALLRTQSDERLVDLVRAGNDRAFEAIVHRYRRPLLRHCRRLLPPGPAEDAVQQAFLYALEAMRADQRDLALGAWLHRIAQNAAIDSVRRTDSRWEELDERMDAVEPTHAAVERRAHFRSVVAGLGALPDRQRRALVLRELEGRSYEEIAEDLGGSPATVRQLLNRARNAMRSGATALVPPALVARLAGAQTAARVAEAADAGGSALIAKGAAVVAAGTLALVTVSGPGDRLGHPRTDAEERGAGPERKADQGRRGDAGPVRADDPGAGGDHSRAGAERSGGGGSAPAAAGPAAGGSGPRAGGTGSGVGRVAGGGPGSGDDREQAGAPVGPVDGDGDDDDEAAGSGGDDGVGDGDAAAGDGADDDGAAGSDRGDHALASDGSGDDGDDDAATQPARTAADDGGDDDEVGLSGGPSPAPAVGGTIGEGEGDGDEKDMDD